MRRRHAMPFGAQVGGDGVRFRLFAPAAKHVDLCLDDGRSLQMEAVADGFFEHRTDQAAAGTRYGFRVDGDKLVLPDPASRFNPEDVHAMSEVIDPGDFDWNDEQWRGRPWDDAVLYELHVGAFSQAGNFDGVRERLPYLSDLGVTALELMPVADFSGGRGWGYDGVLPFAPESRYGRPENMKRLVQAAHEQSLMVILDVVYNHFGPDGNYLHRYAPQFFTDRVPTPWGEAIDFDGPASRNVREFFLHNALYWLEEFNLDGLRIDAVHAIHDRSEPDIIEELASRVRSAAAPGRRVHLILENDHNAARYLRADEGGGPARYDAQWNDDFHHAMHVLLSGETHGYYEDYADDPVAHLARCLAEGFAYQGEMSVYRGDCRGEPSADLPTSAFVTFLQNHDQIGNRAFGERLAELAEPDALEAGEAVLLLAPQPPLLFMGQEYGASSRFPFFCDFAADLGAAVAEGRRREFGRFPQFRDAEARERIPDPNDEATFSQAKLDWRELAGAAHKTTLSRYRELLTVRQELLAPRLPGRRGRAIRRGERLLEARWDLAAGGRWHLLINLGGPSAAVTPPAGRVAFCTAEVGTGTRDSLELPAWGVAAFLET